ncbi:hypothetical protein QWZ13_18200 [Reinekea marina]|nr:hypothetical protein [Reinekea marina]MDN3650843.1 hypothetical protein [Reinekea marina]
MSIYCPQWANQLYTRVLFALRINSIRLCIRVGESVNFSLNSS